MSTNPYRPNTLPKNFSSSPANYPSGLFRLQLSAARRYLFDGELKEVMDAASLSPDFLNPIGADLPLTVAQVSIFVQGIKGITGDDRALEYGREAFTKVVSLIPRGQNYSNIGLLRTISDKNKLFLRIRESMFSFNKQVGSNVLVKWHGGEESELFEDTGQHCYGYKFGAPCCHTLTGFLESAILHMSGLKVELIERECMATGGLACRWHCHLV
jgi:hypothetical protein